METTQTIQEFIEKHGLSMESQLLPVPPADVTAEERKSDPMRSYWTVTIKRDGGKPLTTGYNQGSHYRVWKKTAFTHNLLPREIAQMKSGELATTPGPRDTFHFIENTEPAPPKLDSVLDCLRSDAQSFENAIDFEDFAGELGYDTDSRKAEHIYKECGRLAASLKRLLGHEAYAELMDTVQL